MQYLVAILKGIQPLEEDPDTGSPVIIDSNTKMIFMNNIMNVMSLCWEDVSKICILFYEDLEIVQVVNLSSIFILVRLFVHL